VFVLEEIAAALNRALSRTEDAPDEQVVERLDDHVYAHVLVVHVQARVRFAGSGDVHPCKHFHRDRLTDERRVAEGVVEDEGLQSQKLKIGNVAVDVDPQPGLDAVACALAARPDADVPHRDVVPGHVRRVVGVLVVVLFECLPVSGVHRQVTS
jgi:hypothetical protein